MKSSMWTESDFSDFSAKFLISRLRPRKPKKTWIKDYFIISSRVFLFQ